MIRGITLRYRGHLTARVVPSLPGGLRAFASSVDDPSSLSSVVIPGARHDYGSLGDSPYKQVQPSKAWQAAHNLDVQRATQNAIIYEVVNAQTRTIQEIIPWFLENMPESYFEQVPEMYRMDHMKAIAAVKDANMDLYLNLKSHTPDGRTVLTFIRPGTQAGTLLHMVEELPSKYNTENPLSRLHVFSTKDGTMSLNMFVYGNSNTSEAASNVLEDLSYPILEFSDGIQSGAITDRSLQPSLSFERDSLIDYIKRCRPTYVTIGQRSPRRFLIQKRLFDEVSGTEGTATHVEAVSAENQEEGRSPQYWIDVAVANSLPQVALENFCRVLYQDGFDVSRARLDVVSDNDNGNVIILRALLSQVEGNTNDMETMLATLETELKRAKWLDPQTASWVFEQFPWLGIARGEVLSALACLLHPILAKENTLAYSKANIMGCVEHYMGCAAKIADLFLDRFNPDSPLDDAAFESRRQQLLDMFKADVESTAANEVLAKMIDVVSCTLKTNLYMPDRYALGLRLDPIVMGEDYPEKPFGILFVHGRRFNGFHVRFRDISRGGLRLVSPANSELWALESARHYDECYGLAFAQQLKNKDIPEGGSKAVNLINTGDLSGEAKDFIMRKSVKAFADTILDLIVQTEETKSLIVDRLGKPEVLYLGPDEQVIPDDIDWIVARAAQREYETPAAFMSSKPRAGINHKEFGVTSEGVNVYLDTALRRVIGIDPNTTGFTVKMTGGPDGDVAGNEIKILMREYGENAHIVGVADHSGCAEDPAGLDHVELKRLVDEGLCISHFEVTKLGEDGALHLADTQEGAKARNSMHNRLKADAFLPCGGRPNTIDITNYTQFLRADGSASSPLIVEGANLFVTEAARKALYDDAGVVIVKDSSANKGGVITSSYEICAAMLLTEDEFVCQKEEIVQEVLEKLRERARLEADLLLRESENHGGSLPEVSQVISNCINATTDALAVAVDNMQDRDKDTLMSLFRSHLPQTIADIAFDRVVDRVPKQYITNAVSSALAAKLVYKEGTRYVSSLDQASLASIALRYLDKEKAMASLVGAVNESDLSQEQKLEIASLLEAGGARTALNLKDAEMSE